jgi:hypothetical protein
VIRIELEVELSYEIDERGADFVFNIHAAHRRSQILSTEHLTLSRSAIPKLHTDPVTGNRSVQRGPALGRMTPPNGTLSSPTAQKTRGPRQSAPSSFAARDTASGFTQKIAP